MRRTTRKAKKIDALLIVVFASQCGVGSLGEVAWVGVNGDGLGIGFAVDGEAEGVVSGFEAYRGSAALTSLGVLWR